MKKWFWLLPALPLAAAVAFAAHAVESRGTDAPPERGTRPMLPPPEVLAACQGRAAGDKLSITLQDGRVVAGTCLLVFRPDQAPAR